MSNASIVWGNFALGSRLKLLHENLNRDIDQFYVDRNIEFKTRYYPVFHLLSYKHNQTIKSLALHAGYSHSAMSQTIKSMSSLGYVSLEVGADARERIVKITEIGRDILDKVQDIWLKINQVNQQFINESNVNFFDALEQLESSLDNESMHQRLTNLYK